MSIDTAAPKLPQIPRVAVPENPLLAKAISAVSDIVETQQGQRDPLDEVITWRTAFAAGLTQIQSQGKVYTNPGGAYGGHSSAYTGAADTSTPPTPTGLTANSGIREVILLWDDPLTLYSNHAYTEVWRSQTDDLGTAAKIGRATGFGYSDKFSTSGETYYYWIRFISKAGVPGPYNAAANAGTSADTGFIQRADFAASIQPVHLVDTLPTLPDADYPDGSVAFNKADSKLYRNDSGTWTAAVAAGDITGQIGSSQLAANSVVAGTIAAGAINAGELFVDGVIQGTAISADSIDTTHLAVGAITAGKAIIASDAVLSSMIQSLTADKIDAGTITTPDLYLGDTSFHLDGSASLLTITDQNSHQRVTMGKFSDTNYGIEIRDASNNVILSTARVFDSSMVDALLAVNGPAEAGADVTAGKSITTLAGVGALATLNAADWATQVTGTGKPADNATTNTLYHQGTAPASPVDGDLWADTSTTPPTMKVRVSGAWQIAASWTTDTQQLTDSAGLGTSALWSGVSNDNGNKPADNATRNKIWRQTTEPASGMAAGDIWVNTTPGGGAISEYNGSAWVSYGDITSQNQAASIANQGAFAVLDQITNSNIATYIAAAAIGDAYIADLGADKITAGTITGSTLQTAASGKRFVVSTADNEAHFYDDLGLGVKEIVTLGAPNTALGATILSIDTVSTGTAGYATSGIFINSRAYGLYSETTGAQGTAFSVYGLTDNGAALYGYVSGANGIPLRLRGGGHSPSTVYDGAINYYSGQFELYRAGQGWSAIPHARASLTSGTQLLTGFAYWTPAAGFYNVAANSNVRLQLYAGGSWYTGSATSPAGLVWMDGSNMRLYNTVTSTQSLAYQLLS